MGWTEATGRINKPVRGVAWNHVMGKKDSSKAFVTEAEADAWWRQRESELNDTYREAGVDKSRQRRGIPTLVEYGTTYLRTLVLEDSTIRQNVDAFKTEIRHYFGEQITVLDVKPHHIREMLAQAKARGCGPSGRLGKLVALRKVFQGAVDDGLRTDDPTRGIPAPTVPKKQARILSPDEIAAVQQAMPPWLGVSALVLAHAGLRIAECCGLQLHNVDLMHQEIRVQHVLDDRGNLRDYPKGKEPLPVPMSPDLKTALEWHIHSHSHPESGYVFFNPTRNIPVRPATFRNWFYNGCKEAQIAAPRPTPHDLRHYTATTLARSGAPAYVIQAVLRHRNLATSQRYIDTVSNADKAAAMQVFRSPVKHMAR